MPRSVLDSTTTVPYNDASAAERTLAAQRGRVAAVIVEPVLGVGGEVPADPAYLAALRWLTSADNVVLIFDECATVRLGPWQVKHGIDPDLSTFSKVIGGGLPIGVFGGRADIMAIFDPAGPDPVYYASAFGGNSLSLAAGIAALENLNDGDFAHLDALGQRLRAGLDRAAASVGMVGRTAGEGGLTYFHFTADLPHDAADTARCRRGRDDLRALAHLQLLNEGFVTARHGLLCQHVVTDPAAVDAFVEAYGNTLALFVPYLSRHHPELLVHDGGVPMTSETAGWSLTAAGKALAARRASVEEYITDLLAHQRRQGELGAYITATGDRALAAARIADRLPRKGRLHGLPLVVKDNIDVAGIRTTAGTPRLRDHVPPGDSAAWRRLADAGALLLGKTSLHELAYGVTGACVGAPTALNPADRRRLAGGSSSGTAAAVAGGLAPAGLGTDTGGSARIPAAVCGVVGFRPTTGRYPHDGVIRISPSRDTIGLLARDVADLLLLDAVLTGRVHSGPALPAPARLSRLAVPRERWSGLDSEVDRVASAALTTLQCVGCVLVDSGPGPSPDLLLDVATTVPLAETRDAVSSYLTAAGSDTTYDEVVSNIASPDVRSLLTGPGVEPERYRAALTAQRDLRAAADRTRRTLGVSASVMPTTVLPAAPLGTRDHVMMNRVPVPVFATYIRNTAPAAVLGLPSVTVPVGATVTGLPVGLQFDGHPHGDVALLRLAQYVAQLFDAPAATGVF